MKKILLSLGIAGLLFSTSCSKNDEQTDQVKPGTIVFDISAANSLEMSKGPIYSQEAIHTVENVKIYVFKGDALGTTYTYAATYTVPNWTKGSNFQRFEVPVDNQVGLGLYKFMAVGRDASDSFTLTTPLTVGVTNYDNFAASVATAGLETEIFSGTTPVSVVSQGVRVPIIMTRQVAGVLGYFKNVPTQINGTDVKYLRLSISNSNKSVNLSTGFGSSPVGASRNIIDMDLSGQAKNADGTFAGNDLSAQGVTKLPNTQLSGAFLIPVNGVTLTLGLYDAGGVALKTWNVLDGILTSFNILPNHFYSLGHKASSTSTTGSPTDPTPDAPIDLLRDQSITITINPNWTLIHNLVIGDLPIL